MKNIQHSEESKKAAKTSKKVKHSSIRSFLPYKEKPLLFHPFTNDEILK